MLEQLKQSARDAQAQVKAAEVVHKTELEQLKARVAKLEQDKIELTEKMATFRAESGCKSDMIVQLKEQIGMWRQLSTTWGQ